MSEQFKSIETIELTRIANAIRVKTGTIDKISLEDMPTKIAEIEGGVTLPELENEGSASDLLSGKELIDSDGNIVTGTIETKNSSNLTINDATVTVPAGYYATQATKSVGTTTQATPNISVNSNGLITASATQTAGYVAAGTKSATKQLAFQAAKTITPKATSQIAVSSGYYTGGNITVAGDSNLVAGNIKSGVSIFGVVGNYEGGNSLEDGLITRNVISNYTNDRVTLIGSYAFYSNSYLKSVSFAKVKSIGASAFCTCGSLKTAYFPAATSINNLAFQGCYSLTSTSFPEVTNMQFGVFAYCYSLTSISFPKAQYIPDTCFSSCSRLTTVSFPVASYISYQAFYSCAQLSKVSFPACKSIYAQAFLRCYNLKELYLTGSSVCTLSNSNAFSSTPIGGYSTSAGTYGSIYVPASLLASYKAATNWVYFSSRFVGI